VRRKITSRQTDYIFVGRFSMCTTFDLKFRELMRRVVGVHGSACSISGMRYTHIEDAVKKERERKRRERERGGRERMGFKTRWGSGPGRLRRRPFCSFSGEMSGERTKSRDRSSTRNPVWEQDARESSVCECAGMKSVCSPSISLSTHIPGTSMWD